MTTKLIQFQCQREGELFYYQNTPQIARSLVERCPVCGSTRVEPTGRKFAPLDESAADDSA